MLCLLILFGFMSMHVCVVSILHVPFLLAFSLFQSHEFILEPCMLCIGGMNLEFQSVKSNCGINEFLLDLGHCVFWLWMTYLVPPSFVKSYFFWELTHTCALYLPYTPCFQPPLMKLNLP